MKKILSALILLMFSFSVFGTTIVSAKKIPIPEVIYPISDKFKLLEKIIDKYLVVNNYSYRGIYSGNLMYNKIIEKEIKSIIIETYEGNEAFYNSTLFNKNNRKQTTLKDILNGVPSSTLYFNVKDILFNERTAGDRLMNASFGINYNTNSNDTLISTLQRVIENYKRIHKHYPTLHELEGETIYNNRENVIVGEIMDEIEYKIIEKGLVDSTIQGSMSKEELINNMATTINNNTSNRVSSTFAKTVEKDLQTIISSKSKAKMLATIYTKKLNNLVRQDPNYRNNRNVINDVLSFINKLYYEDSTYTLNRIITDYSYTEALSKNEEIINKQLEKNGDTSIKYKNYKTLIGDKEVKNIPEIYKKIPNDSIFLHVKNPQFIFDLINRDNSLLNSTTGVGVLKKLKKLTAEWFDIDDFSIVEENLKHEFVVVISDLDLTNPDITIIIHKDDKGLLVPTEKAKVTVTKGDYIYITNSESSLDKFNDLIEEDSIYNSLDFKYLWLQKGENFKDIFFFAGDKFFEKMIEFDYFIKMQRKINDYTDLEDLQTYVWGYKKMLGRDITFDDLDNFFKLTHINKKDITDNYSINSESIVKHNIIGTLDNVKGVSNIEYDMSIITSEELRTYQENILKYREIWRASLDPMGIFINNLDNGFSIDFFMTPIPHIEDNDFRVFEMLLGTGIEEFDFLKNKKLRIGTVGGIVGFNIDEIKKRLSTNVTKEENRELYYMKKRLDEFNKEILDGADIFDYLGNEMMFSFGGVDPTILNTWDTEKLDAFFAIEFKSKLKAKEFISIMRKNITGELGRGLGISDSMKSALLKPLSEEYNGETIYTIPIKNFYFPITFQYTLIDNFFYITISKSSIKKIIDVAKNQDDNKGKFIANSLKGKKMFQGFLDADKLSPIINDITKGKSETIEDIYIEMMTNRDIINLNTISFELARYYKDIDYRTMLGKDKKEYNNDFGFLKIKTIDGLLYLSIDKTLITIDNLDIKTEIDTILDTIDTEYFTEKGGELSKLYKDTAIFEQLLKIDLFNKALDENFITDLLLDASFSLNIGENIIDMHFASFGDNYKKTINEEIKEVETKLIERTIKADYKNDEDKTLIYIFAIIFMILVFGGGIFIMKKNKK